MYNHIFTRPKQTDENLHENVIQGTPQFRMRVHFTRAESGYRQVLYTHWHDELEFLFITKGQARLLVGKDEFIIHEKEAAVIKPNTLHSAGRIDNLPIEFFAILVHFNFLASLENDEIQQQYILPIFFRDIAVPVHITAEIDKALSFFPTLMAIEETYRKREKGFELFIKSKLYELLYKLVKYATSTEQVHWDNTGESSDNLLNFNWVRKFLYFIQKNYSRHITLGDMARQVNMSEGHFCRVVKRVFGVPPIEFLNNYRASRAIHLIETTEKNLGLISEMTGFSNVNRFSLYFKKNFHCTPISYRRKIKREGNTQEPAGTTYH